VATRNTVTRQTTMDSATSERTGTEDTLIQQGRTWGLSTEEIARAQVLLRGLRGAFSVPNLSPIEALGIHARTPAERQRYAELFARLHHDDVERVLAWQQAYDEAVRRLYPNEPVIAFTGADPKPEVSPAVAAAAAVPMSAIRPAAPRRTAPVARDAKEAR
jgi:integrating conjugative element protein (TIGR03759 family)